MKVLTKSFSMLFKSMLALAAFFLLSAISYAAAPQGTMTGTVQTLTVGTTAAINTITVTDHTTAEITAANDIRIQIPSAANFTWDTTDTTATINVTGTGVVSTTVSYADSKTLVLNVTTNFGNSANVQVGGLSFVPGATTAATNLTWAIDGASPTYANGNNNTQVTVVANDAAASITLGDNSVVGNSGSTTLTFTLGFAMAATDTVVFTLPSHLDLSAMSSTVTDTFSGAGAFTCSRSGQVVTCTADGAITAGTGTIVLSGIVATAEGNSQTMTSLAVNDTSASGADISADSSGSVTDVRGGLASHSVTVNPPTGFSAVNSVGGVLLTWTDPSGNGAAKIEVLRGKNTVVDGMAYALVELGVQSFLDTDVKVGDEVSYIVRARDSFGNNRSTLSEEIIVVVGEEEETTEEETPTEEEATEEETGVEESESEETTGTQEESTEASAEAEMKVFADLSNDHWASVAVEKLSTLGIVRGNPDGTFAPNENLNRASAAAVFDRLREVLQMQATLSSSNPFSDLQENEWYFNTVIRLYGLQVIKGNPDGTFNPSGSINRAEFVTIAMRFYRLLASDAQLQAIDGAASLEAFSDVEVGDWFFGDVSAAANLGYVEGKDCNGARCFAPQDKITRAEAVVILNRMFGNIL